MKYSTFMLALPALILPTLAAPATMPDLRVSGPLTSLDLSEGKPKETVTLHHEPSGLEKLWNIEGRLDQILASHTHTETGKGPIQEEFQEAVDFRTNVLTQMGDAAACLDGSEPPLAWLIGMTGGDDGLKTRLLESVANATVEATGRIMEKALATVDFDETVEDRIAILAKALFDHLLGITSAIDGLAENLAELLSTYLPQYDSNSGHGKHRHAASAKHGTVEV